MMNAGMVGGNWVVGRQQPVAENGEIIAAMIEGEATVKTFKRSGSHVWLMPHNPAYTPIPGNEAEILGRVVAVLRRGWPRPGDGGTSPPASSPGGRCAASRRGRITASFPCPPAPRTIPRP